MGAGQGVTYARDFFGPYRLRRADAVMIAGAEEPIVNAAGLSEMVSAIRRVREDVPVALVTFRPRPLADVSGARVFFATTAPPELLPLLTGHLEREFGCEVVASSASLSDRARLREDMHAWSGRYDLLLTELKAAAIDVVAAAGELAGVPTVLCDNEPVTLGGDGLAAMIDRAYHLAQERHRLRSS
jgi:cyclic 2,3-diphosphoglycerate synthetase